MKGAVVLLGCLVALASTKHRHKTYVESTISIIQIGNGLQPVTIKPKDPVKNYCPPCECGKARMRRRIVGGEETKILEFPWMAFIANNGRPHCGGSVINDLYVLTAAHCTYGRSKDELSVRLLEHDLSMPNVTKPVHRQVAAIIQHPGYNPHTVDNDIALLKLNERVDLSTGTRRVKDHVSSESDPPSSDEDEDEDLPGVRSVCLPPGGLTFNGLKGVVIGWGATSELGPGSDKLLKVTVPIMTNADCQNSGYAGRYIITDNMLCAGEPEGLHDACQGDSGGPLHVLNSTNNYQQVGVVSWGEGCARPNYPGVYSRVNRYLTWIKRNTQDACYCS